MFTIKSGTSRYIILPLLVIITLLLANTVTIVAATGDSAPSALSEIPFSHVTVESGGPSDVWLKTVGDINGDGLTDLIAGGHASGGLVWYQSPGWTKHTIATDSGFSTDGEVADMDKDGDQDVIALTSNDIRWYENPSWTVHIIGTRILHDLEVSDFDGDGDVDLVARDQGEFGHAGNVLHFYRQDTPTTWTYRAVSSSNGEGLRVVDVDKDNDQDVVIGGAWFENTKNIVGGVWTSYSYTTSWTHPNAFVSTGDINKDGRMDIVLAPAELAGGTYRISWFEAPANPKSANWTEHIVENNVETVVHFVGVADMNNDANLDIVAAEMHQGNDPDEVKVYMNLDGVGGSWQKQVVATTGSHSMRILDVGNDGDNDLYGANWQGSVVEIWYNNSSSLPVPSPTPTSSPILSLDNWQRYPIDSSRPWTALFIKEADIDGDGAKDIVAGGWWYKNPGTVSGVWVRHLIGSPLNNMLALYDFDQDGDTDIFGIDWSYYGGPSNRTFSWARNDGSGNFSIFTNIQTPPNGDFPMGAVVDKFNNTTTEIAIKWHDYSIAGHDIFTVPSDPTTGLWTWRSIESPPYFHGHWLESADIDSDGDKDIMSGYFWFRNNGGNPTSWQEFPVFNTTAAAHKNAVADINKDGRLDVFVGVEAISTLGKLAWYEQPVNPINTWTEHIIDQVVGPMSLDARDMDNDGDVDLIVGEHNLNDPSAARLLIYENLNGIGGSWQQHLVSVGDEHHNGAQVADLDNDGDLDVMSIGWGNNSVLLYENKAINPVFTPTAGVAPSPTATRTLTSIPSQTVTSPSPTATQFGSNNTGWVSPSSQSSQSGGDGNGNQSLPTNAFADGGGVATDTNSGTSTSTSCANTGKDRHTYFNYPLLIPSGSTITGIEMRLDSRADSTSGAPHVCIELSWNNGISWTAMKTGPNMATSERTDILGGSSDIWGRTWSTSELTSANFLVRIVNVSSSTSRDFFLNWAPVRVSYMSGGVTNTPTATTTRTNTPTITLTGAITITPSATRTLTSTATATRTFTPTVQFTQTLTPTVANSFPTTSMLDNFNRSNGGIGSSWLGYNTSAFSISSNQLSVISSGEAYVYWNTSFGEDQEAYFKFSQVYGNTSEQSLLLKIHNDGSGAIKVVYDANTDVVRVMTYYPSQGWVQRGVDIAVTFANGDQFGALAHANGMIDVFRNGTLLASRDITAWPYYASGGYIGIGFSNVTGAQLDDFCGGTHP